MRKFLLILCCCWYSTISVAQLDFAQGFGGQIGFSVNFGSHFNRIGLVAKLFYHYEHIQANVQFCGFYNARSFPTGLPSWEGQMRIGVVGTFGAKNAAHYSPFLNEISNQTSRPFSIGYSYNFYLDNIETSQLTGTFGFGIYGFSLAFENDFLAFLREDKYRSGALGLYYRVGNTQIGLTNIAWTADPYAKNTITNKTKNFPFHGFPGFPWFPRFPGFRFPGYTWYTLYKTPGGGRKLYTRQRGCCVMQELINFFI